MFDADDGRALGLVSCREHVMETLKIVQELDGEGLMLRKPKTKYKVSRSRVETRRSKRADLPASSPPFASPGNSNYRWESMISSLFLSRYPTDALLFPRLRPRRQISSKSRSASPLLRSSPPSLILANLGSSSPRPSNRPSSMPKPKLKATRTGRESIPTRRVLSR